MRKCLAFLCVLTCAIGYSQDFSRNSFKVGAGYAKDFPGLGGYALTAEYAHRMSGRLEAGLGLKHMNMAGTPRTSSVSEYTRATTLDFNLYYFAIVSESNILKFGLGYSFTFYKTRRSFPVVETDDGNKLTTWPVTYAKGRLSGMIVNAEYEYILPSNISVGLKASLCKAYDQVFFIGPFVGIRL